MRIAPRCACTSYRAAGLAALLTFAMLALGPADAASRTHHRGAVSGATKSHPVVILPRVPRHRPRGVEGETPSEAAAAKAPPLAAPAETLPADTPPEPAAPDIEPLPEPSAAPTADEAPADDQGTVAPIPQPRPGDSDTASEASSGSNEVSTSPALA